MANKVTFVITLKTDAPATLTIKHVKYQTVERTIESNGTIEFESILNWDSNAFKISSTAPVTITGIQFKLANSPIKRVWLLKQEINKIDQFPERTASIQNNKHRATSQKIEILKFVPMLVNVNDVAVIRFFTQIFML